MDRILIITEPRDFHAQATRWSLQRRGHDVVVWCPTDFPEAEMNSLAFGGASGIQVGVNALTPNSFDAIWLRRFPSSANLSKVHESDRIFAEREVITFLHAVLDGLPATARWVNPLEASFRADLKPRQLRLAAELGLKIPKTLITNDPNALERFYADCSKCVIYKPLNPMTWLLKDGQSAAVYTSVLTQEDIADREAVSLSPGIYQQQVEKAYEVRAVIMEDRVFAGRIDTTPGTESAVDYRIAGMSAKGLGFSETLMPADVKAKCVELLKILGLRFGVLDLIVEPDGHHVFLEVNEMGQFLGLEIDGGMPLLSAFCDLLAGSDQGKRSEETVDAFVSSDAWAAIQEDPDEGHAPDRRVVFQPE